MRRNRSRSLSTVAAALVGIGALSALRVPSGIGPGREQTSTPHPGFAVKSFDSRWIPVTTRNRKILQTLRDLRLETSTMWFRIDCSEHVYDESEIELVFQGGTVWVAAGQPKPSAPPVRCLENDTR